MAVPINLTKEHSVVIDYMPRVRNNGWSSAYSGKWTDSSARLSWGAAGEEHLPPPPYPNIDYLARQT